MNTYRKYLSVRNKLYYLLFIAFLVSCDEDNSSDIQFGISGNWTTGCTSSGGGRTISNTNYSESEFFHETRLFVDEECEEENEAAIREVSGKYVIGEKIFIDEVEIYEIDIYYYNDAGQVESEEPDLYSIVSLQGENLYFGKNTEENNGLTEETRSNELEYEIRYSKKI